MTAFAGGAGAPLPASASGRTPTSLGLSFPICSNGSAHGGPCGEEGESVSLAVSDSPRRVSPCGFGAPLAPTPPPSPQPSGKFTLCPHSLVALETR